MGESLKGFSASGILGKTSYRLILDGKVAIIVGPNGTGKSTFLSLFYLFLSRQWQRLNEYDFTELKLLHNKGEISISKADILSVELRANYPPSIRRMIDKLSSADLMGLIYKVSVTREEREQIAELLAVPPAQIASLRRYLSTEIGMSRQVFEADKAISTLDVGPIIYLPTYRRIEKDIKSIFPDIEARLRAKMEESGVTARSGTTFKEIASFGMADVSELINSYSGEVKEAQRLNSETASQEYIRDIVRGKIKNYSLSNIRKLDESALEDFKDRLDDQLFSPSDRESLREKINVIRRRAQGQPSAEQRYLGMFVEKLLAANERVKKKELPLRSFVQMVSKYLSPSKTAILEGHTFSIRSTDPDEKDDIPLEKLSSGEKQIVSIFAYLFLSKQEDFVVFIDEPELSLSVPWQKQFLPDVLSTANCAQLVVVTHSPYVFDNGLKDNVIDVRRLRAQPA